MDDNLIIVFDTETNGLWPKDTKDITKCNYPYIVQLSFIIYNENTNEIVKTYNKYIKQTDEIDFNSQAFKINKITKEMCDNGVSIIEALNEFYTYYMNSKNIVGHNIEFDKKMIQLEIIRNFEKLQINKFGDIWVLFNDTFNELWGLKLHCTMLMGKHVTNIYIKGKFGNYKKNPKLIELYEKLFNETPNNLHNSLVDCLVCLKCFVKMKFDKTFDHELEL
jgi:DNA polymerase-3 subunit alpha